VTALFASEPEHPLLENRISAVPEGEREAQVLLLVGDARDPVFARLYMRKGYPFSSTRYQDVVAPVGRRGRILRPQRMRWS
jgi:hypothetical protein